MTEAVMTPGQLIAMLNALRFGEMDRVCFKLDEARRACELLDQPKLAVGLSEAQDALRNADMKTYRKRVETVVSQLGHLR